MKKTIYLLALLFTAGSMVLTSCSKDEDEDPTPVDNTPVLNFVGGQGYISGDATLVVGEEFTVGITAAENPNTKKNISSFVVVRTFNNVPTTVYSEDNIGDPNYSWESTEMANIAIGEERWTFTVTDNGGEKKELSFIITTEAGGSAVLYYQNLDMGSYDDSDYGSFLATIAGNVMKKAQAVTVQELVDVVFFYGASNGVTFGAPSNATVIDVYDLQDWTTNNMTLFMPAGISAADFDEIGAVHAFPSFTGDEDIINGLAAGEVIYFKTVTDKLGYIKINSTKKDGFEINIDMKIME